MLRLYSVVPHLQQVDRGVEQGGVGRDDRAQLVSAHAAVPQPEQRRLDVALEVGDGETRRHLLVFALDAPQRHAELHQLLQRLRLADVRGECARPPRQGGAHVPERGGGDGGPDRLGGRDGDQLAEVVGVLRGDGVGGGRGSGRGDGGGGRSGGAEGCLRGETRGGESPSRDVARGQPHAEHRSSTRLLQTD